MYKRSEKEDNYKGINRKDFFLENKKKDLVLSFHRSRILLLMMTEWIHETRDIPMKINLVQRARLFADQLRCPVDLAGHHFDPLSPLDKLKLQVLSGYDLQDVFSSSKIEINLILQSF